MDLVLKQRSESTSIEQSLLRKIIPLKYWSAMQMSSDTVCAGKYKTI